MKSKTFILGAALFLGSGLISGSTQAEDRPSEHRSMAASHADRLGPEAVGMFVGAGIAWKRARMVDQAWKDAMPEAHSDLEALKDRLRVLEKHPDSGHYFEKTDLPRTIAWKKKELFKQQELVTLRATDEISDSAGYKLKIPREVLLQDVRQSTRMMVAGSIAAIVAAAFLVNDLVNIATAPQPAKVSFSDAAANQGRVSKGELQDSSRTPAEVAPAKPAARAFQTEPRW